MFTHWKAFVKESYRPAPKGKACYFFQTVSNPMTKDFRCSLLGGRTNESSLLSKVSREELSLSQWQHSYAGREKKEEESADRTTAGAFFHSIWVLESSGHSIVGGVQRKWLSYDSTDLRQLFSQFMSRSPTSIRWGGSRYMTTKVLDNPALQRYWAIAVVPNLESPDVPGLQFWEILASITNGKGYWEF